jgi:hypothetical protein
MEDQSVEYSADVLADVPGDAENENISYFLYLIIYDILFIIDLYYYYQMLHLLSDIHFFEPFRSFIK